MREWELKNATEAKVTTHTRYFLSSLADQTPARMGELVRGHWSIENRNHHKRDDSAWQEDRHRHRRPNAAQNLALTRNALLAITPFTDKQKSPRPNRQLPTLPKPSHQTDSSSQSLPITPQANRPGD